MDMHKKKGMALVCAFLLLALTLFQVKTMLVFGNGSSGTDKDDFSDMQGLVDNGFGNSNAPNAFGKELRLRIRELFASHKQAMEETRIRMRLFNEEIKNRREELITEFRRVKNELRERIMISLQEVKILRQKLDNGNISQSEFSAELQRIRLELRSNFNLMLKLGDEIGKLGKELAGRNREFARQLIQERHEFREELSQILKEALEAWKDRATP